MSAGSADPAGAPETPAERAARLRRVFGDPLPATTADERSPDGAGDVHGDAPGDQAARERWLRDNRPPHHGG